jgi:hypothetical protein
MRFLYLLFACSLAFAESGLETPSVGYARAPDGTIVRVSGIAGAFVTTPTDQAGAVSAGFSGQLGFLKLPSAARVVNAAGALLGESDAPDGSALFGFNPRGDAGIAYYPSTQTLNVYGAGAWQSIPFQMTGARVLAVALKDAEQAQVVVARDQLSLVTLRVSDGAVESETLLGPGSGPALLLSAGVLFSRDDSLIYHDASGTEQAIPVSAAVTDLFQMGPGWVQAQSGSGGDLALRLGREIRVYQLPEVSQ